MQLQHARQRLLDARAELAGRLERAHKHVHGREEEVSPNFHEQIVETSNDQVVQFLEQEEQQQLQQIDRALQRIDSGSYFSCSKCGGAIGEQRQDALPWTEFCVDCA